MTIVSTGPVEPIAEELLSPFGEFIVARDAARDTILALIGDATALIVRGDATIDRAMIGSARHLRVIGRTGSGYNNVDIHAATERGIPVVYAPGVGARAVAEGTMAFILALAKRIGHWDEQTKAGNWASRDYDRPKDLYGASLGIIGFGTIGQMVARLACPFEMEILASDPFADPALAAELGVRIVDLDELIRRSQIISVHAPFTAETRGMINRQRIAMMPRGAILVNMARGGLIESLEVIQEGLESGQLAGVGLDVFDPEPPDHTHPIFRMDACLTAPHVLGVTDGAMRRICKSMAEDMAAVLEGREPRWVVNPEALQSGRGLSAAPARASVDGPGGH